MGEQERGERRCTGGERGRRKVEGREEASRNLPASHGDPELSGLCPAEKEVPCALSISIWRELSEGKRPELEPRLNLMPVGAEAPTRPGCFYSIIIQDA